MLGNIGPLEIGIVLVIALIVFGPKRLPELGRGLGEGMRGFKDSITGGNESSTGTVQLDDPAATEEAARRDPTEAGNFEEASSGQVCRRLSESFR